VDCLLHLLSLEQMRNQFKLQLTGPCNRKESITRTIAITTMPFIVLLRAGICMKIWIYDVWSL
jgi:ABC-type lipopolysaccharide export system ATPase subunit